MSDMEEMVETIKMHQELMKQAHKEVDKLRVETTCSAQDAFQAEQYEFLRDVLKELSTNGEFTPTKVIQKGLSAFNKIEARAFIIQNVLESIKRGRGLTETLKEYSELGLVSVQPEQLAPTADGTQPKNGTFLVKLWNSFKRVAGVILGIITSAFKLTPEMAGIKPVVGFTAAFPTITFVIEPKTVTFAKIWEILKPVFGLTDDA